MLEVLLNLINYLNRKYHSFAESLTEKLAWIAGNLATALEWWGLNRQGHRHSLRHICQEVLPVK